MSDRPKPDPPTIGPADLEKLDRALKFTGQHLPSVGRRPYAPVGEKWSGEAHLFNPWDGVPDTARAAMVRASVAALTLIADTFEVHDKSLAARLAKFEEETA